MNSARAPQVTAIVPTRRSGRTIERCLRSLRLQETKCEIIVVDNYSDDETIDIARRYADLVLQVGPERSAQRNEGLRRARTQYVFFIDSDMYFDSDVVGAALKAHLSTGKAIAVPEESIGTGFWSACRALERTAYTNDRTISAARFFPRELLVEIGGYDEHLYAGEDWDLSIRAEARIGLDFADARIFHDEGHLHPFAQWAKKFYYGKGLASFIRLHPEQARARLNPARSSLVRSLAKFYKSPVLLMGLVVLKGGEAIAGAFGVAVGLYSKKERA